MPKRSKPYQVGLTERLQDKDHAANYMNAALEDSNESFLVALRDVADAQSGLGKLAESARVNRENLYRMLSADGNPGLNGLSSVLQALGFKIKIETGDTSGETNPG
jgi:probable addiction module antidote protein